MSRVADIFVFDSTLNHRMNPTAVSIALHTNPLSLLSVIGKVNF